MTLQTQAMPSGCCPVGLHTSPHSVGSCSGQGGKVTLFLSFSAQDHFGVLFLILSFVPKALIVQQEIYRLQSVSQTSAVTRFASCFPQDAPAEHCAAGPPAVTHGMTAPHTPGS